MASFIEKFQGEYIVKKSSQTNNSRLDYKVDNIKTFVQEATPDSIFSVGEPDVVLAMIHNGFATALTAAKIVLNAAVKGVDQESFSDVNNAYDVVYNSALIINTAIKSYNEIVEQVNKNYDTAFNLAWSCIYFSKSVPDFAKETLKYVAGEIFGAVFKEKSDSVIELKNKMKTNFGNLKEFVEELKDTQGVSYSELSNNFATLKNTFDSGIDD